MHSFITHWKSLTLIFFMSTLFVIGISPVRSVQTIDFVQARAALKIDNFHAREYTAKAPRLALQFTQVAPNEVQAIVPAGQRQPRAIQRPQSGPRATAKSDCQRCQPVVQPVEFCWGGHGAAPWLGVSAHRVFAFVRKTCLGHHRFARWRCAKPGHLHRHRHQPIATH